MGMKRVIVTGAAGFTGRHACLGLAASGWEVVAVVSGRHRLLQAPEKRLPAPILGAARTVSCDLTDREAVRALWRETAPDALLHLAGQNAVDRSWREPDLTLAANALSTVYLLEAMRAGGSSARALVVGSMLREPIESSSHPYAYSKSVQASAALAWHRWYGLPVIVAEPSNLIGPGGSAGLCGRIARWAAETEAAERASGGAFIGLADSGEGRAFGGLADSAGAGVPEGTADGALAGEAVSTADGALAGEAGSKASGAETEISGGDAPAVRRPAPFRLSSLTELRDYLDVRDGVAAYELLLRAGTAGCVYPIESGTMRSLGEVKETFERLSPVALQWQVGEAATLAPSPAPRDCAAIRSLGWEPSIPFADSIADALRAERERIGPAHEHRKGESSG